ncbi:efflux transporter periplasmic adaptor subunit [Piscirickettsia salmonis]|uniref:Multidrug transporter MdtA n=1 Tax=Piscirickettsia salmonis TaxID=1238 RepID=A0A9Q5YKW1_PISSA|nr:efflux RND transporter periplasmic adaptor subunit [Piscirickettsia salmonis]ALA26387.1 MexH family multidrug efflux RND transporter periplasmic adaptor subunit [Piscirickettsia salmonis]APS43816.1 efflux transporter periplasmic adaptor subunit [Piscirickettsia salmonis]APS47170.1 efflux transporter periplasmic adaptor subunit [Piscirickettsia salmonis]APS51389.1 efflux transporter periplasmic adaptor subunit [Piscirickettsia salmonis]APS54600.1 efflux transporter periplasmic adaptor subuni
MSRRKAWLTLIILIVLLFGTISFFIYRHIQAGMKMLAAFIPPPATVSAVKVTETSWQPYLQSVGSLVAVNGVNVTSQVSGQVERILFQSGDFVEKGRPLVQLDDRTEQANLLQYKAKLKLDQLTYDRDRSLLKKNAISRQDVDTALTSLEQTKAQMLATEVSISQKLIRAPFSGKIGIRNVNLGQYISPGTNIVSLQSINPLHVNFSLPQEDMNKIKLGQKISAHVDTFAGREFTGTITAMNSEVDSNTRTIEIQASLPNPKHELYPGMFTTVQVYLPVLPKVLTLPHTAVTYTLYGNSVYLIQLNGKKNQQGEPTGTVTRISIQTGDQRSNTVVINKGLKAGDLIVDGGQLKLENGAAIALKNTTQ